MRIWPFHILANTWYCVSFPFEPGGWCAALFFQAVLRWDMPACPGRRGAVSTPHPFFQLASHGVCPFEVRHGEHGQMGNRAVLPSSACHARPHALWAWRMYMVFFPVCAFWRVLSRPHTHSASSNCTLLETSHTFSISIFCGGLVAPQLVSVEQALRQFLWQPTVCGPQWQGLACPHRAALLSAPTRKPLASPPLPLRFSRQELACALHAGDTQDPPVPHLSCSP